MDPVQPMVQKFYLINHNNYHGSGCKEYDESTTGRAFCSHFVMMISPQKLTELIYFYKTLLCY